MNIFSYIKTKIHILEVVNEYTALKKAGNYWKGNCPFHSEKTASFTVSPHKEIFYCFGCHTGGDIITFISKVESCTPLQAANHLAEKYSIPIPQHLQSESDNGGGQEKSNYFNLCKTVANWCHEQLLKHPYVMKYLLDRGFNKQTINLFQLGYFPGGLSSIRMLTNYAATKNFIQQDLLEAKIIAEGKRVLYSPFEDRIIFPIQDIIGQFCGFGGRIFKSGDQRAKYYNSHENHYFSKGSLLFGFDLAKKNIKNTDHMFIVEGYTDCIAMAQHGFSNTVATLGTACTLDHLKILSRYVDFLYVMYDGDNAGQKAIMRLTELCWQVNLELRVIAMESSQDPASFLHAGGNLQKLIKEAKDLFVFFIETVGKGFLSNPLSQKLKMAQSIIKTIENVQDPIKKDLLLQRASKTLGIPIESIKSKSDKASAPEGLNRTNSQNAPQTGPALEKKIFFAIINNTTLLDTYDEEFSIAYFPQPIKGILQKLKLAKAKQPSLDFITFFDTLDENDRQYISKILLEFDTKIEKKTFEQLLLQFQKKHWKHIVQNIKAKLSQAKEESNDTEVANILQNFLEIKKRLLSKGLIVKDSK